METRLLQVWRGIGVHVRAHVEMAVGGPDFLVRLRLMDAQEVWAQRLDVCGVLKIFLSTQ